MTVLSPTHPIAALRDGLGAPPRPNPLARLVGDAGETLAYAFDRDIRAGFWDSTLDSFKMIPAYLGFYLLSERLVAEAVVTRPFSRFVRPRVIADGKVVEPGNEHTVRSVINVFGWFAAVYSVRIVGRLIGGAQEKKDRFAQDFLALAANHAACLRDDLDVAEHVFIRSGGRFQELLYAVAEQNAPVREALQALQATFPDMAAMIRDGRLADPEAVAALPPEQAAAFRRFTEASANVSVSMGRHLSPEDMARLNLMASAALESRLGAPARRAYLGPVQPHADRGFFARLADRESPASATDVQAALATLHAVAGRDLTVALAADDGRTLDLTLDRKSRGRITAAVYDFARAQHLQDSIPGRGKTPPEDPYEARIQCPKGPAELGTLRDIARAGAGALLHELETRAARQLKRPLSDGEMTRLLDQVERAVHPLLERPALAASRQPVAAAQR